MRGVVVKRRWGATMTARNVWMDRQRALRSEQIRELVDLIGSGMDNGNCRTAAENVYGDDWRPWRDTTHLAADMLIEAAHELGMKGNALQPFREQAQKLRRSRPPS